jgi:hypothetical protein
MKHQHRRTGVGLLTRLQGLIGLRLFLLACGATATFVVSTTLAAYSDSATSANTEFSTGSVTLGINPSTALFNVTSMKPGDVFYAPLTVTNNGTLAATYAMTASASNVDLKGLAAVMIGEVRKTPSATCNSTTFAASGTTVAANALGLALLATSAPRSLAAGASEYLCFQVTLPLSVLNATQGATTTASFTFTSTQA